MATLLHIWRLNWHILTIIHKIYIRTFQDCHDGFFSRLWIVAVCFFFTHFQQGLYQKWPLEKEKHSYYQHVEKSKKYWQVFVIPDQALSRRY